MPTLSATVTAAASKPKVPTFAGSSLKTSVDSPAAISSLCGSAFGYTGKLFLTKISAVIVVALGLWMLIYAFKLYKEMDAKTARKLMIVSVSYISLLQIVFILDKFLR